jgi:hypothetical protein
MNTDIPSYKNVFLWYNETLKLPSFLETLNNYQKEKLIEFCDNKIYLTVKLAAGMLDVWPEEKYPKDLLREERLNYILNNTFKNANRQPVYILNLLGYTWTPKEGLTILNKTKLTETNNKFNAKYLDIEGNRFSQPRIALYLIYKQIVKLHDPRSYNNSKLFKIAKDFGWPSVNSAYTIYEHWNKRKDNQIQRLGHKNPKSVKKDIESILYLLNIEERNQAELDIKYLNKKIELNN